jgi:hypothetical protein
MATAISSTIPGLHVKGELIVAVPMGRILRGITLETSGWTPSGVYVWTFVQPLYVPFPAIVLSLGNRLGGGTKTWSLDEVEELIEVIRDDAEPFYGPISTPEAMADWDYLEGRLQPYPIQAKAYSLIACGRPHEAIELLTELAVARPNDYDWETEIREQAATMADLAANDLDQAHAQLKTWENETIAALGVGDIP